MAWRFRAFINSMDVTLCLLPSQCAFPLVVVSELVLSVCSQVLWNLVSIVNSSYKQEFHSVASWNVIMSA